MWLWKKSVVSKIKSGNEIKFNFPWDGKIFVIKIDDNFKK